ncbi:MAG: hypothetical protein WDN28_26110 [Chthoniobacter sp.]
MRAVLLRIHSGPSITSQAANGKDACHALAWQKLRRTWLGMASALFGVLLLALVLIVAFSDFCPLNASHEFAHPGCGVEKMPARELLRLKSSSLFSS